MPSNWFDVKGFGAIGDGATDDTSAVNAAISAAATAGGGVVLFSNGDFFLGSDVTFPGGVTVRFDGGLIRPDSGVTATILGAIDANPRVHIFAGDGVVRFNDPSSYYSVSDNQAVYPQWWGAKGDTEYTVSPTGGYTGGTDDTLAFQKCIDAVVAAGAPKRVVVPIGIYKLSAPLIITTPYTVQITIEGEGDTYPYTARTSGTVLYQSNPEAPAIIVNGGRAVSLKNLMIWGSNDLAGPQGTSFPLDMDWILDESNFVLAGVRNNRYSPHAGIAFDPFADLRHGTGTLASSTSITSTTQTWAVGNTIAGVGIPAGTTVTAVAGTTITISAAATASGTGVQLYRGFESGVQDAGYPGNDAYGVPLISRYVAGSGSASCQIEDVSVQGFAVGAVLSLGGNGNCSEMQFTRVNAGLCHTAFAFGFSQSRSVFFENCLAGSSYVGWDTRNYGPGVGSMPQMHGCGGGWCARLFNVTTRYGHLNVTDFYCEGLGSLGFVGTENSSCPSAATFTGCSFNFARGTPTLNWNTESALMPDFILSSFSPVVFTGCSFGHANARFLAFNNARELTFDGCVLGGAESVPDPSMLLAFQNPRLVRMIQCKFPSSNSGSGHATLTDQYVSTQVYNNSIDKEWVFHSGTFLDFAGSAPVRLQGYGELTLKYLLSTASVSVDGAGGATVTFSAGDARKYVRTHDLLYDIGPGGTAGWEYQGWINGDAAGSNTFNYQTLLPIGVVESIDADGSGNPGRVITLSHVPYSYQSGSGVSLQVRWMGRVHERSTGDTTTSSNQVTSVTNIASWSLYDRITGPGIPDGTYVSATPDTVNNVLTLSQNATATATGVELNGASVGRRSFDGATYPTNSSIHYRKGDRTWNTAPTPNTNDEMGWVCTASGYGGSATWKPFGHIGA